MQQYSYMYSYGQIALAITRAITGHTRSSKSTDYCPNCTLKCVINYTNNTSYTSISTVTGHDGLSSHSNHKSA